MSGKGPSDISTVGKVFRDLYQLAVVKFPPKAVCGEEMRKGSEHRGVITTLIAMLTGNRIPLQVDIGFGYAVTTREQTVNYPVIMDFPAPRLKAYTRYMVIAGNSHTVADNGLVNSRMKDYYNLWYIQRHSRLDGNVLSEALNATSQRRKTPLSETLPVGLDLGFSSGSMKQLQWAQFLKKTNHRETAATGRSHR